MVEALTARFVATVATFLIGAMLILMAMVWLGEQAAKRQNKELRADLVTTNQAWGECKATLAQADGKIAEQTEQVKAWKIKADTVQREAEVAVAKARQEAAQYRRRADRLAALPTPSGGQCEAAAALYVQVISEDVK